MSHLIPTLCLALGWLLAEVRLLFLQRAWSRERADLLNRVQAGSFAEYQRHRATRAPAPVEVATPEFVADEPAVPQADVVSARAAFRNLSE